MNHLVKILTSDDGDPRENPVWCLVDPNDRDGTRRTLCEGEAFGMGESSCKYKEKFTKKGGITCPDCIQIIKEFKSIKL